MAVDTLVDVGGGDRDQYWHVDRTFHYHSRFPDHYPDAVHLAPVQTVHRDPHHDWHLRIIHVALHVSLAADPDGPGLGSPGRTERPHPAQSWKNFDQVRKRC